MFQSRMLGAVALAGAALSTTGCIGFLVGYGVDMSNKKIVVPTHPDSIPIKTGKRVKVVLRNGARASGEYRGVVRFSESEYAARYGASRDTLAARSLWVPPLGTALAIERDVGDTIEGQFSGLDHDGLLTGPAGAETRGAISFKSIRAARAGGLVVSGGILDSLVRCGALPTRSALVLEVMPGEPRRYGLNEIRRVERTGSTGRWVGAAVELAVYVVAMATWEGMNLDLGGNWGSLGVP